MATVYATPGVYIEENSAFPNTAVPVATAVPAFIGYTKQAMLNNKDITNVPTRISSFGEFLLLFGGAPTITYTVAKPAAPSTEPYNVSVTTRNKRFYLFHCIKLFFANGGSDCYIVSIGNYEAAITKAHFDDEDVSGPEPVLKGLRTLLKEPEPTMVVMPDIMSLSDGGEVKDLQNAMLIHCGDKMRNRFAILDVYDGYKKLTPDVTTNVVEKFRENLNSMFLQWGAGYYPWVSTTITGSDVIDFTCVDAGSHEALKGLLKAELPAVSGATPPTPADARITEITAQIDKISATKDITLHQTLLAVSPLYKAIMKSIQEDLNLLPPSAGMAGIYSMVDNNVGVFQSPANVSFGSVVKPAVNITHDQQENLNLPLNGRAVNAIRTFPGKGVLVWGARTLDGNSQDWRYISVRRTVIFIEQSIKYAAEPYVFAPNTSTTWTNIRAMISNFLTNVWQQGALAGAKPEDAFSVDVGLGSTMTPVDILDGIMRITIKIAVTRPAEFIVITFEQKMQQS